MDGAAAAATREQEIAAFLSAAGHGGATTAPLAGDASNRRYLRVAGASGPLVLMDAPPARNEPMAPFVAVTEWLRALGHSAPRILAADLAAGLILLEDLGDDLYARVLAGAPAEEGELYGAAVDLLARIAREAPGAAPAGTRPYDRAELLREARLAVGWWADGAGAPLSADAAAEYDALVGEAVAAVAEAREVTVLRDYHAENLIWLPGRAGTARVGLLDYQDALLGHAAYDLVSLLEDARRDTSPALQEAMLARYLAAAGLRGVEAEAFRAAYAALGAQRNLKIVGIFARLAMRDGKPRYLDLIPRVRRHLARDLAHPALAPLARFVAARLPEPTAEALARIRARTARA